VIGVSPIQHGDVRAYGCRMNPRDLFVHAGVAGLLAAGVATAAMTVSTLADSSGGTQSVYVPIAPCRLADTRPAPDNVGTRATPLAQTEIQTFQVWGTNGNCTIPTTATGIGTNVTAVNPTADGYLTVYPADVERPLASNLNWTRSSPPTPNQVTVGLSATGAIAAYNNGGNIDVIIDIVGYYQALPASGTGPQGPAGQQGATGATGPAGPPNRISNSQIALLRWDQDPGHAGTYPTGDGPRGIAYDGTSIWVANYDANNVSKINPATGTKTDFPSGTGISNPHAIAFDGTSIWVANYTGNNVSKINPATGTKTDYPSGTGTSHPYGIAFDGTSIWVANEGSNNVSKINPSTGAKTDYPTGTGTSAPRGVAFDGTSVWVANSGNSSVSQINPSTGSKTDVFAGFNQPSGMAFDGAYLWVTNYGNTTVARYDPATSTTNYYSTLALPLGIAFDGGNMWVANNGTGIVSKFDATNGNRTDYLTGGNPYGIAFDGTNVWVTNQGSDTVSKIYPG